MRVHYKFTKNQGFAKRFKKVGDIMEIINNSKVLLKDINYISKKDNQEKHFKQLYISIDLVNGNKLVYKCNIDYNNLKNLLTHISYNGVTLTNVD